MPLPDKIDGDRDAARVAARIALATEKRLAGYTWDQVAKAAGYADRSTACKAVLTHLRAQRDENITALRDITNARYEKMLRTLWPKVVTGDLPAMREYRKILADQRRHNGLDAPIQVTISSGVESRLQDVLADASTLLLGLTATDVHDELITDPPPALEA